MARPHLAVAGASHRARRPGLRRPRPTGRVDRRHLRRVLDRIGLIQIDSVNVLVRSQELPLFARLGPHPANADRRRHRRRRAVRVLGARGVATSRSTMHRCSAGGWASASDHAGRACRRSAADSPSYIDEVLRAGAPTGPSSPATSSSAVGKKGTWWDWDDGKIALEQLFYAGASRPSAPLRLRPRLRPHRTRDPGRGAGRADARPSTRRARSCSRWPPRITASPRRATSPTTTARSPTQCASRWSPSWSRRARLLPVHGRRMGRAGVPPPRRAPCRAGSTPARCSARSTPWCGTATGRERLFGFHYRIEIYTPAPKRSTATTCCRSCSATSWSAGSTSRPTARPDALLVQGAFGEPGVDEAYVAEELAAELVVDGGLARAAAGSSSPANGDLAPALARALA